MLDPDEGEKDRLMLGYGHMLMGDDDAQGGGVPLDRQDRAPPSALLRGGNPETETLESLLDPKPEIRIPNPEPPKSKPPSPEMRKSEAESRNFEPLPIFLLDY